MANTMTTAPRPFSLIEDDNLERARVHAGKHTLTHSLFLSHIQQEKQQQQLQLRQEHAHMRVRKLMHSIQQRQKNNLLTGASKGEHGIVGSALEVDGRTHSRAHTTKRDLPFVEEILRYTHASANSQQC